MLKPGSSLIRRTLLAQTLTLALFFFASYGAALFTFHTHQLAQIDIDLRLVAATAAKAVVAEPQADGAMRAAQKIEEMQHTDWLTDAARSDFAWQVWRRDGTLIARSQHSLSLPNQPPGTLRRQQAEEHNGWILMAIDAPGGDITVVVGYPRTILAQRFWRSVWSSAPYVSALLVLVSASLWCAILFGLRPLVRLCNEIGTHRPTVEHDDAMPQQRELATMVAAMNQLRAQARAQRQHEWTFLADSAHALRAPLAAINAQAYALAGANSLADRQAALRAIESGVARSADMLDKLLALAQLDGSDPSTIRSEPAPLNVCAMVREVLAAHTPRALASGHALGASAAQTVWAMAEQSSLRLALDNLVDNAIRHTERGCRIEVSVTANQEQVCILVEDSGPGIADTERERLLGPVVRPGHSRQRQGIGLGLAIVVAAMRRCRGSVTLAASASLGGAKFSLQLAAGPSTISVEKK